MPCAKVKGRTETGSPTIDYLVHAWFGRTSHQHYLQCLYSHDSLPKHTPYDAAIFFLSSSATLPLIVCIVICTSNLINHWYRYWYCSLSNCIFDLYWNYFWYCYYESNHLSVPFTPSVETICLARLSRILIYVVVTWFCDRPQQYHVTVSSVHRLNIWHMDLFLHCCMCTSFRFQLRLHVLNLCMEYYVISACVAVYKVC
jgi:hypothetical protein